MRKLGSLTFIFTLACLTPLSLHAITVVSGNTSGTAATYGSGLNSYSSPSVQTISTSLQNFNNSILGTPSAIGEQVPSPISMLNGVAYDVWMNGPVLSRYYNTNIYTAGRNAYSIDGTLPLNNQTIIPGAYGFPVY